jgi:hypothetical protein
MAAAAVRRSAALARLPADDPRDEQAVPELAFFCPACAEHGFADR